jgi:hypothetical protein
MVHKKGDITITFVFVAYTLHPSIGKAQKHHNMLEVTLGGVRVRSCDSCFRPHLLCAYVGNQT